jgi:hypothetical protein
MVRSVTDDRIGFPNWSRAMSDPADLLQALEPVIRHLATVDLSSPELVDELKRKFPPDGTVLSPVAKLIAEGIAEDWLCPRGEPGVRFGRLCKATDATQGYSIDAVDMTGPGPGHEHPNGEIDLCFSLEGDPEFDGQGPGWTVYPPGSWHIPTVRGGRMAILYFLPKGSIRFGPRKGD